LAKRPTLKVDSKQLPKEQNQYDNGWTNDPEQNASSKLLKDAFQN
jgi:hypothetical protein